MKNFKMLSKFKRKVQGVRAAVYLPYELEPEGVCFCHQQQYRVPHIHRPELEMQLVREGDWVVSDSAGNRWVMSNEEFQKLYERDTD